MANVKPNKDQTGSGFLHTDKSHKDWYQGPFQGKQGGRPRMQREVKKPKHG